MEFSPNTSELPSAFLMRRHAIDEPRPILTADENRLLQPRTESTRPTIVRLNMSQLCQHPFHVQIGPDPPRILPTPCLGSRQAVDRIAEPLFIHEFGESRDILVQQASDPTGKRTVEPLRHR